MDASILLIGYGNPGRGDDGLGPALAGAVEHLAMRGVTVEIDYQLTVDHARLIADHDIVVFADAMMGLPVPYQFGPVMVAAQQSMGSHQISPEAALTLASLLFGRQPQAWMLAIAGSAFGEVKEGLSPEAEGNLAQAIAFITGWIAAERPNVPVQPGSEVARGGPIRL